MHVIVGAGPVGSATARLLAARGERVRVITRSGSGPRDAGIERVAADAADPDRLAGLTAGATAIYNCANPPYHRWPELWPPLAAAMLGAAERSGAALVIVGNLYGYGPVDGPMTERTPLRPSSIKGGVRAAMWRDALAAHEAGRVRVTEVRASDFLGPGGYSLLTHMVLAKVVAGRRAMVPVDLDAPHSWTYIPDVARTLIAAATDERAWGHAWHVPTAPAVSVRDAARRACALIGAPAPKLSRMPGPVLWLGGLLDPRVREFREVAYQFQRPFVLDSSHTSATFGLDPTPFDDALRETAHALLGYTGSPSGRPSKSIAE
ncbi:MAG TPA: NAD-dependent epimerase/dehydratase family protein [Pilimelia sp.]|nr:NAD-dependent epimerase/dehydratase family protein [Pilimelia sp.]